MSACPGTIADRDIQWWLDRVGVLDQRHDEVDDLDRARRLPSFQLVGSPERRMADLNALSHIGVQLVGRIVGIDRRRLQFSGSLPNQCALADLKLGRLLDTIDRWVERERSRDEDRRAEPLRPDDGAGASPPGPGRRQRRDRDDHLGDRLPAGLFLA